MDDRDRLTNARVHMKGSESIQDQIIVIMPWEDTTKDIRMKNQYISTDFFLKVNFINDNEILKTHR